MSDWYHMWRGQLWVGSKDVGAATIWSNKNSLLPAIGENLRMTSFGEYGDLWEKIIGTEPFDLSKGSVDVNEMNVSVFKIEGHSPCFMNLTKELIETSQPRVLMGELHNPESRVTVVLIPHFPKLERIGLQKSGEEKEFSLHAVFVSNNTSEKAKEVYKIQRDLQILKMERTSAADDAKPTTEKISPLKAAGDEIGFVIKKRENKENVNDSREKTIDFAKYLFEGDSSKTENSCEKNPESVGQDSVGKSGAEQVALLQQSRGKDVVSRESPRTDKVLSSSSKTKDKDVKEHSRKSRKDHSKAVTAKDRKNDVSDSRARERSSSKEHNKNLKETDKDKREDEGKGKNSDKKHLKEKPVQMKLEDGKSKVTSNKSRSKPEKRQSDGRRKKDREKPKDGKEEDGKHCHEGSKEKANKPETNSSPSKSSDPAHKKERIEGHKDKPQRKGTEENGIKPKDQKKVADKRDLFGDSGIVKTLEKTKGYQKEKSKGNKKTKNQEVSSMLEGNIEGINSRKHSDDKSALEHVPLGRKETLDVATEESVHSAVKSSSVPQAGLSPKLSQKSKSFSNSRKIKDFLLKDQGKPDILKDCPVKLERETLLCSPSKSLPDLVGGPDFSEVSKREATKQDKCPAKKTLKSSIHGIIKKFYSPSKGSKGGKDNARSKVDTKEKRSKSLTESELCLSLATPNKKKPSADHQERVTCDITRVEKVSCVIEDPEFDEKISVKTEALSMDGEGSKWSPLSSDIVLENQYTERKNKTAAKVKEILAMFKGKRKQESSSTLGEVSPVKRVKIATADFKTPESVGSSCKSEQSIVDLTASTRQKLKSTDSLNKKLKVNYVSDTRECTKEDFKSTLRFVSTTESQSISYNGFNERNAVEGEDASALKFNTIQKDHERDCGEIGAYALKELKVMLTDIYRTPKFAERRGDFPTCDAPSPANTVLFVENYEVQESRQPFEDLMSVQYCPQKVKDEMGECDADYLTVESDLAQGIKGLSLPEETIIMPIAAKEFDEMRFTDCEKPSVKGIEVLGVCEQNEAFGSIQEQPLDLSVRYSISGECALASEQQNNQERKNVLEVANLVANSGLEVDVLSQNLPSSRAEKQFLLDRFLAAMDADPTNGNHYSGDLTVVNHEDLSNKGILGTHFNIEIAKVQHPPVNGVVGQSYTPCIEDHSVVLPPALQENLISSSVKLWHTPEVVKAEASFDSNPVLQVSSVVCDMGAECSGQLLDKSDNHIVHSKMFNEILEKPPILNALVADDKPDDHIVHSNIFNEILEKPPMLNASVADDKILKPNFEQNNLSNKPHETKETIGALSSEYAFKDTTSLIEILKSPEKDVNVGIIPSKDSVHRCLDFGSQYSERVAFPPLKSISLVDSQTHDTPETELGGKAQMVMKLEWEYNPSCAGVKGILDILRHPLPLNSRFERSTEMDGVHLEDETRVREEVDALVIKKIHALHCSDYKQSSSQSSENCSSLSKEEHPGSVEENTTSEFPLTSKGSVKDEHQPNSCGDIPVVVLHEIIDPIDLTPIDQTKAIFVPGQSSRIEWEKATTSIMFESKELSKLKRVHLVNASQSDLSKLKLLGGRHGLLCTSVNVIEDSGGCVYVRPELIKDLFRHPSLRKLCEKSHVRFGVCISLMDIFNCLGRPVLISKWLLLIHHTSMLDTSLGLLLEAVFKDGEFSSKHHHQVFISALTLKICYCSLAGSQRSTAKEEEAYGIVLRNLYILIRCIKSGVGQIIDGGSWQNLGSESSISEFLSCLKVTHQSLQYIHRHAAVIVGENNRSLRSLDVEFYETTTAKEVVSKVVT